jgi:hypothetical protein
MPEEMRNTDVGERLTFKMDIRERASGGMEWFVLAQDSDQWRTLVDMLLNFQVQVNVWKFLTGRATGSFSRRTQLHEVGYLLG